MKKSFKINESSLAYLLLAPSMILLILLIGYPMISNIIIAFQDVPLNPKMESIFIGLQNYKDIFLHIDFYKSLLVTLLFTTTVVILSTVIGLAVAIFLNRDFMFKRIVQSIIILSYVVPAISLIFAWKYMFNNTYGIINYITVDLLGIFKEAPLWFDRPISAFVLVSMFCIWKFFPYAYISFYAILQTIDRALYEAASIDGANWWEQFYHVTLPAIKPVLATVVSLRTIWVFYMYAEVHLLTNQLNVIGVYLYKTAFSVNDLGKAAAISIVLFIIIFVFLITIRKKVFRYGNE